MTIVLEHQFWDLAVTDDAFAVTLSFQNRPERLTIPLAAISAFTDPSVKFELRFQQHEGAATPEGRRRDAGETPAPGAKVAPPLVAVPVASERKGAAAAGDPKKPGERKSAAAKSVETKSVEKKPGEIVALDTFRKK